MPLRLPWQRRPHPVAPPPEADERLRLADSTDWMATARLVLAFSLDTIVDAPPHVPGWLLPQGTRDSPRLKPVPIANHYGHVRVADAIGLEAVLAAHYLGILLVAPGWEARRASSRGCFDVDLVIGIADEHDLSIEMFNGAAQGAAELLAVLADADGPAGCFYDSLDQGWALRVVATNDAVFTREWDWERPAGEDAPRALRFPRRELALQAAAALERLHHLHGTLVRELGTDLWNQPPPPQAPVPSASRPRIELVLLMVVTLLALLRRCVLLYGTF